MSSAYLTFLFLTYPAYVHSNETKANSPIYALFKISVLPYTCSQLYLWWQQDKMIINQNSTEMFFQFFSSIQNNSPVPLLHLQSSVYTLCSVTSKESFLSGENRQFLL